MSNYQCETHNQPFPDHGQQAQKKKFSLPYITPNLDSAFKFNWKYFKEEAYVDELNGNSASLQFCSEAFQKDVSVEKVNSKDLLSEEGNFYTKETFGEPIEICKKPVVNGKYSEFIENLKNHALKIHDKKCAHTFGLDEFDLQQHRIFLVNLIQSSTDHKVLYKESGSPLFRKNYKSIFLVGDSRLRNIFSSKEDVKMKKPFLHILDNLSLFSLMDFFVQSIPKVKLEKGRALIICSVGIRDVVRTIDEKGIYLTIDDTINEMKRLQKEFKDYFGEQHDLLFTDILPVDFIKMAELQKEILSEQTKCRLNESAVKIFKFTYLLSKNMMVENLSRLRHLPPWELFMNPVEIEENDDIITIPLLNDGLNPNYEMLPNIGIRISKLIEAYSEKNNPPLYNDTKSPVYFICNQKFLLMDQFWPKLALHEKPHFIFLKSVSSSQVLENLKDILFEPDAIIVLWFDFHELLHCYSMSECEELQHDPLLLDFPAFLKSTEFFDRLTSVRKKLQNYAHTPNVILTTLCPIDYKVMINSKIATHFLSRHTLDAPDNEVLTTINQYLLDVCDQVNKYIVQYNRIKGLPTWDICNALYKRSKLGSLQFNLPISPSNMGDATPPSIAKIMMTVRNMSVLSNEAINWRKHVKQIAKNKPKISITANRISETSVSKSENIPVKPVNRLKLSDDPKSHTVETKENSASQSCNFDRRQSSNGQKLNFDDRRPNHCGKVSDDCDGTSLQNIKRSTWNDDIDCSHDTMVDFGNKRAKIYHKYDCTDRTVQFEDERSSFDHDSCSGLVDSRSRSNMPRSSFDDSKSSFDNCESRLNGIKSSFNDSQTRFDDSQSRFDDSRSGFDVSRSGFDDSISRFERARFRFENARSRFGDPRYEMRDSKLNFDDSRYRFDSSKPELDGSNSRFEGSRSRFEGSRSSFEGSQSKLDSSQSRCDGSLSRFDGYSSRFDGYPSRFDGYPSRFDGSPSRFDGSQSRFDGSQSRFDGSQSRFDGSQSSFDGSQSRFDSSKSRFDDYRLIVNESKPKNDDSSSMVGNRSSRFYIEQKLNRETEFCNKNFEDQEHFESEHKTLGSSRYTCSTSKVARSHSHFTETKQLETTNGNGVLSSSQKSDNENVNEWSDIEKPSCSSCNTNDTLNAVPSQRNSAVPELREILSKGLRNMLSTNTEPEKAPGGWGSEEKNLPFSEIKVSYIPDMLVKQKTMKRSSLDTRTDFGQEAAIEMVKLMKENEKRRSKSRFEPRSDDTSGSSTLPPVNNSVSVLASLLPHVNESANVSTSRLPPVNESAIVTTSRLSPANRSANFSTSRLSPVNRSTSVSTSRLSPANRSASVSTSRLSPANRSANVSTSRLPPVNISNVSASLLQLADSLKNAHLKEIDTLRKDPGKHPNYAHQHCTFIQQAMKTSRENGEEPNMESIERMWGIFWNMQFEKSFMKTWEKRVEHLTQIVNLQGTVSEEDTAYLALLKESAPSEDKSDNQSQNFTLSETTLLNRLKKKKVGVQSISLVNKDTTKNTGVSLGEKMLSQVQWGWRSIGLKASQKMLNNALLKIENFMEKPDVSVGEKVQYLNLIVKLKTFIEFLVRKEINPYDLDYESISAITSSFSESEVKEYIKSVLSEKDISNPALEDINEVCKTIMSMQKRKRKDYGHFVSSGKVRI